MKPLFIVLLTSAFFTSQAQIPITLQESLEKIITQNAILQGIYGMSVAITMPDGSTWSNNYGVNGQGDPITDSTLFYAGSSNELYVATLILKLEEEGLLNVKDKAIKYIAPINNVDTNITVAQLLNHISGLPSVFLNPALDKDLAAVSPNHKYKPGEALQRWLNEPSEHVPGTIFYYYNPTDYIILSLIIEAVTHHTIQDELRRRFWQPLDMRHTFWAGFETHHLPIAGGWTFKEKQKVIDFSKYREIIPFITASWGSGNLMTTTRDACKFIRTLASTTLLGFNTFTKFQSNIINIKNLNGYEFGFGLERLQLDESHAYGTAGGLYYFLGNGMLVFHHPTENLTIGVAINTYRISLHNQYQIDFLAKTHIQLFTIVRDSLLDPSKISFSKNDK